MLNTLEAWKFPEYIWNTLLVGYLNYKHGYLSRTVSRNHTFNRKQAGGGAHFLGIVKEGGKK